MVLFFGIILLGVIVLVVFYQHFRLEFQIFREQSKKLQREANGLFLAIDEMLHQEKES